MPIRDWLAASGSRLRGDEDRTRDHADFEVVRKPLRNRKLHGGPIPAVGEPENLLIQHRDHDISSPAAGSTRREGEACLAPTGVRCAGATLKP